MILWLIAAVAAFLAVALLMAFRARRERSRDSDRSSLPTLVFFPPPTEMTVTPRPGAEEARAERQRAERERAERDRAERERHEQARQATIREQYQSSANGAGAPPAAGTDDGLRGERERFAPPPPLTPTAARAPQPVPGTLVMLPGRLEVLAGESQGHDIRFVRTNSNGVQRVTVGRGDGAPYEHIQLNARTVSRRHAQLSHQEGRWSIENLSSTNPLLLNGEPLAPDAPPQPLGDGDMIEMGEVVFRFREH